MFSSKRLRLSGLGVLSLTFFAGCAQTPPPRVLTPEQAKVEQVVTPKPEGPVAGRVVVIYFSDLHGQLRGHPSYGGGYARLARLIQDEKKKADAHTDVFVVMGGDAAGKSALPCRKSQEAECFPLLKDMGVDLSVLGNGELKRSAAELGQLTRLSQIPWISSNVHAANAAWADKFHFQGTKSGADWYVLGWSVAPSPGEVDPKKVGYTVNPLPTAAEWSAWKKLAADHPILWVTHQNFEDDVRLSADSCVNFGPKTLAILKAHNHLHREDHSQCAPIFEPGAFGEYASRLTFERSNASPDWFLVNHEFVKIDPSMPEDSEIKNRVADMYHRLAPNADEVVGQVSATKDMDSLAAWLAQAYKKVSQADVAIVNLGAVKSGLEGGPLTREMLLTAIPYSNPLMGADVSAAELSKAVCAAYARPKNIFDDGGGELVFAGARLVGGGTPTCHLELPRRARVKIVMDAYLVKRSPRWVGFDLAPRSFKFGMDSEQAMLRDLQLEGKKL